MTTTLSETEHTLIHAMCEMERFCIAKNCKEVKKYWRVARKAIDTMLLLKDLKDTPIRGTLERI